MNFEEKYLYGKYTAREEKAWQIRTCMDIMYGSGRFEVALELILQKEGYGYDYTYCSFPDWESCDKDEHFYGVAFETGHCEEDSLAIFSEDECYHYLKEAARIYVKKRPERKKNIDALFEKYSW